MKSEVRINCYPVDTIGVSDLTYVVIGALEGGDWIFVRHRDRDSWELPAGHIEAGESPMEAAERELYEETGTLCADIRALHDYSVEIDNSIKYGRLYFAAIEERGPLPEFEISEIVLSDRSPEPATYPEAHRKFMELLGNFRT